MLRGAILAFRLVNVKRSRSKASALSHIRR
jgi:hypothetical protein